MRDLLNSQQDESKMGDTSGGHDGIKLTAIAKCTKDVSYEGQPASSLAMKVTSYQENEWRRYIKGAEGNCAAGENACIE